MEEPIKPPEPATASASQAEEEFPLLFNIPVGVASRYAHHLAVQTTENEVIMSFFEVIAPLLIGTSEEQKETLKKGVRADCVARVTVSRARYQEFVRTLFGQLRPDEKKSICA